MVRTEVLGLRDHETAGVFLVDGARRDLVRHVEDPAGAQAVDVAADKGIRVGAIQGDQHLLQADTARVGLRRDLGERVAFLHLVRAAHLRRGRRDGTLLDCARRDRCSDYRGLCWRRTGRRNWCGRRSYRLRSLVLGGVKQERVFAHKAAGVPGQLHQHVEERLADRRVGRKPDHRLAVFAVD